MRMKLSPQVRQAWMKANYFIAVALAMLGWLSLFAWIAMQFF
jgi:hypothetical protein